VKNRVLLIEDDFITRLYMFDQLKSEVYTVIEAATGEEALSALERNMADLILMDMSIPGLSGKELVEEIKTNYGSQSPAIVIVTGNSFKADHDELLATGVCEILVKPFDESDFRKIVKSCIS